MRHRTTRRASTAILTIALLGLPIGIGIEAPAVAAEGDAGWWAPVPVETPPNSIATTLADADSVSLTDAWAVGRTSFTVHEHSPVVMRWDGSSWAPVDQPFVGNQVFLEAVAVVAPDDVWVAGTGHFPRESILGHWDGEEWTEHSIDGAISVLSLAARSTSNIWALAESDDVVPVRELYRWNGTEWSFVPGPVPEGSVDVFYSSVFPRTATDVWVVGWSYDGEVGSPLAARWNGSAWTLMETEPASEGLGDVIALGPNSAWVTGSRYEDGVSTPLVQHWDGEGWTSTDIAGGQGRSSGQLAAASGTDIWQTGSYFDNGFYGWFSHYDGESWSAVDLDLQERFAFEGIAMPAPEGGFVVGTIGSDSSSQQPLAYVYGTRIDATVDATVIESGGAVGIYGTVATVTGADTAGLTVHVTRVDRDGNETALPDVITGVGGAFTHVDHPTTVGLNEYRISTEGDVDRMAGFGTASVTVLKMPTSIHLEASETVIDYAKTSTLTASLDDYEPDAEISFYQVRDGRRPLLLATKIAGLDGEAPLVVKPPRSTRYFVESSGDDTYLPDGSTKVTVRVRPLLSIYMDGEDGRDGDYYLYGYDSQCGVTGRGCPKIRGQITPAQTSCVRARLQAKTSSGWKEAGLQCFTPKLGAIKILFVYDTRDVIGIRWRVRFEYPGTRQLAYAESAWRYFRITA